MKFIFLAVFPFLGFSTLDSNTAVHQFHLSKCLIEYNEAEAAIQVSMHLFIDDLEDALRKQGADKLFLCSEKEASDAETHLERYISKHLKVSVNGQPLTFSFLGKEPSEDLLGVWCYLEAVNVRSLKEISVTYDILMEAFEDQKNVVSIRGPEKEQESFLFQKGSAHDSVSF